MYKYSFAVQKRSHTSKLGKISYSSYVRATGGNNVAKFFSYIYDKNLCEMGLSR